MNVQALRRAFILNVRLAQLPQIWRTLRVRSDILLGELHTALQLCFGWADQHMHYFLSDGVRYGIPEPESADDEHKVRHQARVRLDQLIESRGDLLEYVYDFGDCWEHLIVLASVEPFEAEDRLPRCLAGALAGPPEDCGGPRGYAHLVKVIADTKHKEHADMLEWLGGYFFPDLFDINETNERLALHARKRHR